MNKEIFLKELRRFLGGIPEEEREQAIHYYEDYFADAGPENEQKVIEELGSPIDLAKQIMSSNQENIAYGQGNDFHYTADYPNIYNNEKNSGQSSQNHEYNTANGQPQKSWKQDSGKITILVILALLAIPVGIPLISAIFSLLISVFAVILALIITGFCIGFALVLGGIILLFSSLLLITACSPASILVTSGISLIMISIGSFLFWFTIIFCCKFFPAAFSGLCNCFRSIGKKIKNFFN